jgi:DNA topoisomerase-3
MLLARSYVRREKRRLHATQKGVFLIDTLKKFSVAGTLASPEKTALWEMELARIATGKGSVEVFLGEIEKFVRDTVREFLESDTAEVQREAVGHCPLCGRDVVEGYKAYECSAKRKADGGCPFVIWKKISGKRISPAAAAMLLNGKSVGPYKGFVSKKKKRFSASLRLVCEDRNWVIRFLFDNSGQISKTKPPSSGAAPKDFSENTKDFGACPACGGKIIKGKRGYGCSNWKTQDGGCRFVIWEMISGKKLTPANIRTLTGGKTTRKYVFKMQNGGKFRAKLKLERNYSGRWETVMLERENY